MADEENNNSGRQSHSEQDVEEAMVAHLLSAVNGGNKLETVVQAYAQEYENIDQTLDEIDGWMTKIEQQNDTLYAELDELLESSRQARKELREQNEQAEKLSQNTEEEKQDKSDT